MAFQSVPETAQAFVECLLNGQTQGMTFYFSKAGGYTESDLENLAADIDNWFSTELLVLLTNNMSYVKTTVRGLENEEDYVVENNDSAGVGGVAQDAMSNQVTWAAKRLSGLTGRSARGRVYIPGLPRSYMATDESRIQVASLTDIITALLEIATYAVTHGWVEVIVSRWHNNVKRATAVTNQVTDWSYTDNIFDTQRRRQPSA